MKRIVAPGSFGVKDETMSADFDLNFGHLDQDGFVSFLFRDEEVQPPCFQNLASFDPAAQIDEQMDEWGEASRANHPTQIKTEFSASGQHTVRRI